MRVALISLDADHDGDSVQALTIAGRALALRQFDFIRAAGCERLIVIGAGATPQAVALRHAAERAGMGFSHTRDLADLPGAVVAEDKVVVLAPGLLADARDVLDTLGERYGILVLPADPGIAAGFERIDRERAWAGVLVMPGALMERLADLPFSFEPASALLRVALQVRLPERRLAPIALDDGSWAMPHHEAGAVHRAELAWQRRHLAPPSAFAPTEWLAHLVLSRFSEKIAGRRLSGAILLAIVPLVLLGAVWLAWVGLALSAFFALALAALIEAFRRQFMRFVRGPMGAPTGKARADSTGLASDLALLACIALSVPADWYRALFVALVFVIGLRWLLPAPRKPLDRLARDRTLLAILLAVSAALASLEPLIMAMTIAILVRAARFFASSHG